MITDNFGGRKFLGFVIAMLLTASSLLAVCLSLISETFAGNIITTILALSGIFVAGNIGEKYIAKQEDKNGCKGGSGGNLGAGNGN